MAPRAPKMPPGGPEIAPPWFQRAKERIPNSKIFTTRFECACTPRMPGMTQNDPRMPPGWSHASSQVVSPAKEPKEPKGHIYLYKQAAGPVGFALGETLSAREARTSV